MRLNGKFTHTPTSAQLQCKHPLSCSSRLVHPLRCAFHAGWPQTELGAMTHLQLAVAFYKKGGAETIYFFFLQRSQSVLTSLPCNIETFSHVKPFRKEKVYNIKLESERFIGRLLMQFSCSVLRPIHEPRTPRAQLPHPPLNLALPTFLAN